MTDNSLFAESSMKGNLFTSLEGLDKALKCRADRDLSLSQKFFSFLAEFQEATLHL